MKTAHAAMILCALMALMVVVTWQMWLNPVVDSGREMNVPLRFLEGENLYSQVYNLYGPFTPLFNAALYVLFGTSLTTLYWAGIAGSLLLILSIFYLGCRFMPPFQSMLSAVAVLLLCVFKENGNLIFPYSYAVLYGTLSGTLALVALMRYFYTDKYGALLAAGILSGLAFCCKMEFGIAVIAALLTVVSITPRGRRLRVCRFLLPGFIVFPVLVGVLLFTRIPLESFFMDTFVYPGFLPDEITYFYKAKLGFNDLGRTFRELISALAVLLGCAGLFSLASIRLARDSSETGYIQSERHYYRLWGLTLGCIILIPVHCLVFGSHWDMNPLRALPLLFIGMIFYCAKSLYDHRERGPVDRALLVVSVYSLAVLARFITRVPGGGGYGVGLLPVPLMLFFYMAVTDLSVFRVPVPAKKFRRRAISVFLAIALAATMGVIVFRYREDKHITVHTPRGNFTLQAAIGSAMNRTLEYISRNSNPGEYILSLPEGSSLNFLADRPAPLRHEILIPGLLDRPAELEAIQILKEKNVRLIFMFNRPTSEYGAKIFGRDYYRTLMEWIESNYKVDAVFGDGATTDTQIGDAPFFIKCYKRK